MAKEYLGKIVSNEMVAHNQFQLKLELHTNVPAITPGQFCMISINDSSHLLRRPFGIFQICDKRTIVILYKIGGEGTKLLSQLQKGVYLSVLLPLGNGYNMELLKKKTVYIVAGGIGLGSVGLLLNYREKVDFFYGAKSKKEFVPLKVNNNITTHYASDDGSKGEKGFIVQTIIKNLKKETNNPIIYACGPTVMLKSLYQSVRELSTDIPMYFSLEERMACGIGVCMGCVVEINNEYKRVCTDGPVFNADAIRFVHT